MIGNRIERARHAAGLSLRALAEQIGLSAMAISKYEREEVTPGSDVLLRLARALGVRVEYFFRTEEVELKQVEYRKRGELKAADKKKIHADVEDQLERWLKLEEVLPGDWSQEFALPKGLTGHISSLEQIEELALALRDAWQLGHNPILDLIDTLEEHGIRVITVVGDEDDIFDGLSATCCGGMPVVVVGSRWPGDRQRFTLAHELGHLVVHGRLNEGIDEEKAANRFAGAFLAPRDALFKTLGSKRKLLELQELILLKAEYGMSVQGLLYRAGDLNILSQNARKQMWGFLRRNGLYDKELGDPLPPEQTRLFKQRIYRALAEGLIGDSKAAELLGMPLIELRKCRHMECPSHAAD
ncbi:MAG: XRE family transcriptional regulator [Chromatiales bacterium]|nr:XRE family transcriptional regulator [Chromatiales bacterium]